MADTKIETLNSADGYVLIGSGAMRLEVKNSFVRAFYGAGDPSLAFSGTKEEKARQVKTFHTEQEGDIPFPWEHQVWIFNPIDGVPVTLAVTAQA